MPTYTYEVMEGGVPTGETFDVFQRMSEEALSVDEGGRCCRRAVVLPTLVVPAQTRSRRYRSEYRGVHRIERTKDGVYNPAAKNGQHPGTSLSMPPDPRAGVVRDGVRHHTDGTITAMNHQPIIRNGDDRKKFCERLGVKHLKD